MSVQLAYQKSATEIAKDLYIIMLLGPRQEVRRAEPNDNGLHPVVRMRDNLRKCETLCKFIYKKYFYENKWQ